MFRRLKAPPKFKIKNTDSHNDNFYINTNRSSEYFNNFDFNDDKNSASSTITSTRTSTNTSTSTSQSLFVPLEGYPSFLSPKSTNLLHASYRFHLKMVSELAFGSPPSPSSSPSDAVAVANHLQNQAARELFRIIEKSEREREREHLHNSKLLHHASQAWNLDFFFRGLTTDKPSNPPPGFFVKAIEKEFGTWDNFKRIFQAHATGMIGCGWVWLVNTSTSTTNLHRLTIQTTFNGASPLFKDRQPASTNRSTQTSTTTPTLSPFSTKPSFPASTLKNSPILGLNLWESAFILDYELNRDQYICNWWKSINWDVASVLLSK